MRCDPGAIIGHSRRHVVEHARIVSRPGLIIRHAHRHTIDGNSWVAVVSYSRVTVVRPAIARIRHDCTGISAVVRKTMTIEIAPVSVVGA